MRVWRVFVTPCSYLALMHRLLLLVIASDPSLAMVFFGEFARLPVEWSMNSACPGILICNSLSFFMKPELGLV